MNARTTPVPRCTLDMLASDSKCGGLGLLDFPETPDETFQDFLFLSGRRPSGTSSGVRTTADDILLQMDAIGVGSLFIRHPDRVLQRVVMSLQMSRALAV